MVSPRVVILVPRRDGFEDRDRLWAYARTWWENDQPTWPIFEGHHEEHEGPFNRSVAINRAAEAAGSWDVAVIIDSDVLCDPNAVRAAVDMAVATNGMVLGYTDRYSLSPRGTERVMGGFRGNWKKTGFLLGKAKDACSSCVVVTRELWEDVGGFDEAFVGWGWEDVAFRIACETLSGRHMVKIGAECWHLHHVVSSGNNPEEATFRANRSRGERYKQARWDRDAIRAMRPDVHPETRIVLPPTTIPRIIHRTVPATTTAEVDAWWSGWAEMHPGWTLMDHRDPLDPVDWPLTSDLWARCTSGAQLAGLIRLEALFTHGGVYVDSDVECYRSLEPLLGLDGFAGFEDMSVVPDAVLGARPQHPAVEMMLSLARQAVEDGQGAWDSGPGVTTSVLPGRRDWLLLPPGSFYPYHYSEKKLRRGEDHMGKQPWAFGAHHWSASWLPPAKRP